MVEPETAGDPMGEQQWPRSSLRVLRNRLAHAGHQASAPTVSRLLKKHDYALRVNAKQKEAGAQHPERDAQFRYIARQKQAFMAAGEPIISVDTKHKELIGDFKNAGQAWRREAEVVNVHDFLSQALGRGVPYGIYDVQRNEGAVYVGQSAGHRRVCRPSHRAVVARARAPGLPQSHPAVDSGGCGWQQWVSAQAVERAGAKPIE